MAGVIPQNWRKLCLAAQKAKVLHELMEIVQQLNKALESEEQRRRDCTAGAAGERRSRVARRPSTVDV